MKTKILLLALVSIFFLGSCNYFKKHRLFSKDVDSVLDMTIEEPQEEIAEDTTDYFEDEFEASYIEEDTYNQPMQSSSGDKYFMIVGSFQNQQLANAYSSKMQQMGYSSEVLPGANGFYRVSAKSYNNYQQGIGEIDDFRNSLAVNAWLHVKR